MKQELRQSIRARISALLPTTIEKKSLRIHKKLFNFEPFKTSKIIGLYIDKDWEILTHDIIVRCWEEGKEVYLPRLTKVGLEFRKLTTFNELVTGAFSLQEPSVACPLIAPEAIDLILIPGVAFDPHGYRIGRGGGFYDRYFEQTTCPLVGLAFEMQLIPNIHPEKHDQKVSHIITEARIIDTTVQGNICAILDGEEEADLIINSIKQKLNHTLEKPHLAVIWVGDNKASESYILEKKRKCEYAGVQCIIHHFSAGIPEKQLITFIKALNQNPSINGILVQLPLPNTLNLETILKAIDPSKDVDGLRSLITHNKSDNEVHQCCTPQAIMTLLEKYAPDYATKKIVLVGHGLLVGKPLAKILKARTQNLTICTKETQNIEAITIDADIIITGTGVPELIREKHIKTNALIIDAGTALHKNSVVGDVHFADALQKASLISPVPGGVGPMTIAMLISNTYFAYELQKKLVGL